MRPVRLLGLVTMCLALGLGLSPGGQARTLRPLTRAEFRQLTLAQQRIRSLEAADAHGRRQAAQVCTRLRSVSPLLSAVRAGCLDLIRLGADNAKLNDRATRCGVTSSSQAQIYSCLVPAIESFETDARAFYRDESTADRLARARGFSSACVAVIGDSPGNIAAEGRLAADLAAAVQALRKQDPQALQTLFGQVQSAVKAIRPGPTSLSLCPHR